VAAVERQQQLQQPHLLLGELQQLLHQMQLPQRMQRHHDIYPTSKLLTMRHLL
jgi:hypothetical protein